MGLGIDPNWSRISRWCVLGTIVMVLWSLAPVAKCSWTAFRDEPLEELQPTTDGTKLPEDRGFLARWGDAISVCYARTPLLDQEAWKRNLLLAFAGIALGAHLIARYERWRKRTYDR